jgi:hypothetical protein
VGGVTFSAPEWQAMMRFRVGVRLQTAGSQCPHCLATADEWGDHFLCCAKRGTYRRHNKVRVFLAETARGSGLRVEMEPTLNRGEIFRNALNFIPAFIPVIFRNIPEYSGIYSGYSGAFLPKRLVIFFWVPVPGKIK